MHKKTAICVSLLLLASLPALATPLGQSDCLTVFGPTGAVFAQTCVAEANELAAQFLAVNLPSTGGPSGFIDTSMFGQPTLVLDPDGSISDIFGIVHDNSGIQGVQFFLGFASDTEGASAWGFSVTDFPIHVPEGNGGPFDATMYLSQGARGNGYTAQFTSDADSVPEPGSFMLLCTGLFGIAETTRRRFIR